LKNIKRISTKNAEFQIIEALKINRSKRTKQNQGFIEGIESLKQAIDAQIEFTRVIFPSDRKISDWGVKFLKSNFIENIIEMDQQLYNELCDRNDPSEFIATFRIPERILTTEIITDNSIFLLLDRPSDKGNLGSIIRRGKQGNPILPKR
jgi:tRNA G18 (ribose-2'-O)-methylase SpoU